MKHREPPKPIYYDNAAAGQCRYCGDPIYNAAGKIKTRANWHPHCLEEYKAIYWPGHTRKVVFKRDRGVCFVCGHQAPTLRGDGSHWHVDHVRPLIEAQGDLDFWRLPNLVTLCVPCHKAKTSIEATERAAIRRQAKLVDGSPPPE